MDWGSFFFKAAMPSPVTLVPFIVSIRSLTSFERCSRLALSIGLLVIDRLVNSVRVPSGFIESAVMPVWESVSWFSVVLLANTSIPSSVKSFEL